MGKSLSDALKKAGLEVNSTESQDVAREPLTLAIKLSYLKHYSSEISRVLTKLQSINNDAQEELDTLWLLKDKFTSYVECLKDILYSLQILMAVKFWKASLAT